jgi:hypothetical protein
MQRGSQDKIKELWEHINLCIILLMTQIAQETRNSRSNDHFKLNKDYFQQAYQVTMPRGLGWSQELKQY